MLEQYWKEKGSGRVAKYTEIQGGGDRKEAKMKTEKNCDLNVERRKLRKK
jgi:hypothetical protein